MGSRNEREMSVRYRGRKEAIKYVTDVSPEGHILLEPLRSTQNASWNTQSPVPQKAGERTLIIGLAPTECNLQQTCFPYLDSLIKSC